MRATFARMFNTDLVPPVSSAWVKAEAMLRKNTQPKALAGVGDLLP